MLFGKSRPEEVDLDSLDGLLNALFEKKLGQLGTRAFSITSELHRSKESFIDACSRLEALDVAPYTEDLYNVNVNSIKTQKATYAKALKKVTAELSLDSGRGSNSYERYRNVLASVEKTAEEVMKTNAAFKHVMYCYSNHLGLFKKSFSTMERQRDDLRRELDNKFKEAEEYTSISSGIMRLKMEKEEITRLNLSLNALEESVEKRDKNALHREEAELSEVILSKKAELSRMNKEITGISGNISMMTKALERPAKKFDHLSMRKKPLYPFIENPIASINSKSEYDEFMALLADLKKSLQDGTVDAKNKDSSIDSVSSLMNSNLLENIDLLKASQVRLSGAEEELRLLEQSLSDLRKGGESAAKATSKLADMKKETEGIKEAMSSSKAAVEKMFFDLYGKSILIRM